MDTETATKLSKHLLRLASETQPVTVKRILHSIARGLGCFSSPTTTPRVTFPVEIFGPDLGFRTFRPGRKPNEHPTP